MEKDFKVKVIGVTEDPQLLSVAGALGCFEEKSSDALIGELLSLPMEQRLKKERAVLRNSFGRGHGSVGDQNHFIFSIENLPRLATLQLCQPHYLAHLQQSLRRAKASRGFHLSEAIQNSQYKEAVEKLLYRSFELYEEMSKAGIPDEDARYILPLCARTNIQTAGNARELSHLWKMTHSPNIEAPVIVKAVVDEMLDQAKAIAPYLFEDFKFNYETLAWYPSAQLYASHLSNKILGDMADELAGKKNGKERVKLVDYALGPVFRFSEGFSEERIEEMIKEKNEAELQTLKHIHFEFLVPMSLACFHQAIRQRTWDHSVEPIYDAVFDSDGRMAMPPKIERSKFASSFAELHSSMLSLCKEIIYSCEITEAEAIGLVPHSLKIYDWVHINGWNALHSIGKRTCLEAQGEIMKISRQIAGHIKKKMPALGKWSEPQCIIYGYCPEIRDCGYYKKKK